MAQSVIHSRHLLKYVKDESYQEFGDIVFYPNGGVKLGPTLFAYRAPIHRHRFGANLVACRNIDEPNILEIETPFGSRLRFLYRPLYRCWYQLVEVEDPRLTLHQERYGTAVAIALYYVRWGVRWVFIQTLHFLLLVLAIALLILIAKLVE